MPQATLFDLHLHSETERLTIANGAYKEVLDETYARVNALLAENRALHAQVQQLETERRTQEARLFLLQTTAEQYRALYLQADKPHPDGDRPALIKELTKLAASCHPDRWHGSEIAEEMTKLVLGLRDRLTH